MADVPAWHAKGEWFDVCRCNVPCPCSGLNPPTTTTVTGSWSGTSERAATVMLHWTDSTSSHSPVSREPMGGAYSEPKMGVVMDERADEGQREALQMIFGGQAGGWPARLNEIFGPEMLGLEFAPIEVKIAPDQTSCA